MSERLRRELEDMQAKDIEKTLYGELKGLTALEVSNMGVAENRATISSGSTDRKRVPICSGVIDYFPAALAEVAKLSHVGNAKHNPGEPLHWARDKSTDHADCIARHLVDRGLIDPDTGLSHSVEIAWRALAMLQEELEAKGAPKARGAR